MKCTGCGAEGVLLTVLNYGKDFSEEAAYCDPCIESDEMAYPDLPFISRHEHPVR